MTLTPDDREELILLLPFYANGTLDAEDRARIDAALAHDAELRAELADIRGETSRVTEAMQASQLVETADTARLQNLMREIEALPPQTRTSPRAPSTPWLAHADRFFASLWKPALTALAAITLTLGVLNSGFLGTQSQNDFTTLSGPDDPALADAPRLIVRLTDDAAWPDISALLETNDLQIVEGPRDGFLILAAPKLARDDAAGLSSLIESLQQSDLIDFAGPES